MSNKTILIVDDEERNIKLLKGMLVSENYQLAGAFSGGEALKMVADISPDLILLDVMMPGIDGFEVCRNLKQDEKTRAIPVVMVTALREKEHRVKAMDAGADDFLSKPVDSIELLVRVKSLLRIKSYHDDLLESYKEIAEKNEKLQELDKMKEGLTHMVVHDLNNPFMAISCSLELLLLDKEFFPESKIRILEKCVSYCSEVGQLIQVLLDIQKMEKGKLQPNKEMTDPVELIDGVMEQFLPKIEKKQITLFFRKPGNRFFAEIDRGLIKRVVANLLNNATRHAPEQGRIEIGVDLPSAQGNLCISIKDNGSGLEPEYHRKVFDKFEQVTLKKVGIETGASGLGLAFCKMATEAHGGEIWVESKGKHQGCTFSFTIPAGLNTETLL